MADNVLAPGGMLNPDFIKGETVCVAATGEVAKISGGQWQAFSRHWVYRLAGHQRPYHAQELRSHDD